MRVRFLSLHFGISSPNSSLLGHFPPVGDFDLKMDQDSLAVYNFHQYLSAFGTIEAHKGKSNVPNAKRLYTLTLKAERRWQRRKLLDT